ncbi:MAG: DNA repair exonuclease [Deltaproteobacteria bacterium]
MRSFTFIHAADLHLDSPFKGIGDDAPRVADALRKANYGVLDRLAGLAEDTGAEFLLLAGDVFDWSDRSIKAQLALRDCLKRLSDIGKETFMVYGNHDPLAGRASPIHWPDRVHVFGASGPETLLVDRDGCPLCAVTGMSYGTAKESRNLARMFPKADPGTFSIGLLHCSVGTNPAHETYAPCDRQDLLDSGMDYWALGHVHEKAILCTDPPIVYPGNTQGRSFKEQGERGCFVVSVDARRSVHLEFVPLDAVRWSSRDVSIDGIETLEALENALMTAVEDMAKGSGGRGIVCRLDITGRGGLALELRRPGAIETLLERLRDAFADSDPLVHVRELSVSCRQDTDRDARRLAGDFLAELLVTADTLRERGSEGYAHLREQALWPLFGNRRINRLLSGLDHDDAIEDALVAAESLCMDLLEGDGS